MPDLSIDQRSMRGLTGVVLMSIALAVPQLAQAATRTTGYDYDSSGMLVKEVAEPGDVNACVATTYVLDAFGRRTTIATRNCNGSTPQLAGAVTEAASPAAGSDAVFADRGGVVSFTPAGDAERRFVASTKNALGHTDTMTYDKRFGQIATLKGPNGLTTDWAFDAFGRKIQEVRSDGNGTQWDYVFCSGVNGGTLACPTLGVWAVRTTPVHGASIAYDSNGIGTVTAGTQNGAITIVYFDALGHELRTETQGFDGSAVYVDTGRQRGANGDTVKVSQPYYKGAASVVTTSTFDILGRPVQIDAPTGSGDTATTRLSYAGLTVTTTTPDPNVDGPSAVVSTAETRNRLGLLASVRDALNHVTSHTYDAFGNRAQTIDPAGNVSSAAYDAHGYGLKTSNYDPDLGVWSFTYDALGEARSQRDPVATAAGKAATTFVYDKLGRMTAIVEPDLSSTWTFDNCTMGLGKLCETSTDAGFDRKVSFDAQGRPTSSITTMPGGASYAAQVTFDVNGRVDKTYYPGSAMVVQNAYTPTQGYLASVTDVTSGTASIVYWTGKKFDAAGRPLQFSYGNGITTSNTFFDDGRLDVTSAGSTNQVLNLQYSYHRAGTVSQVIDYPNPGATQLKTTYSYDPLSRLTGESRSGGDVAGNQTLAWTYDSIGNIASRADSGVQGGYVNVYDYNGGGAGAVLPHAVANVSGFVSGVVTPRYAYDANGNMLSGAGRTMAWTYGNMLKSVTRGSTTLAYLYDADHQRASETETVNGAVQRTTHYLNPAAGAGLFYEHEFGTAGTFDKYYITAMGQTVGVRQNKSGTWSTLYWHKDNLGSNVATTTDDGVTVVERLAYEPFGSRRRADGVTDPSGTLAAQSTDRGYTGHEEMDEVSLVNMNGRVFDAQLGRFLSADTTIARAYDPQSLNRYAYASNNPMGRIDPSGHIDTLDDGGLSGSFIGDSLSEQVQLAMTATLIRYDQIGQSSWQGTYRPTFVFSSPDSSLTNVPGSDGLRSSIDNSGGGSIITVWNVGARFAGYADPIHSYARDAVSRIDVAIGEGRIDDVQGIAEDASRFRGDARSRIRTWLSPVGVAWSEAIDDTKDSPQDYFDKKKAAAEAEGIVKSDAELWRSVANGAGKSRMSATAMSGAFGVIGYVGTAVAVYDASSAVVDAPPGQTTHVAVREVTGLAVGGGISWVVGGEAVLAVAAGIALLPFEVPALAVVGAGAVIGGLVGGSTAVYAKDIVDRAWSHF
jgi:RHS repeat-associated protein